MMNHPDEIALVRWHDGIEDAPAVADHLAACAVCQDRLAGIADEARLFGGALRLTSAELTFLSAADLAGQLVAAVYQEQVVMRRCLWHLGALAGLIALVALAWLLLEPIVEPFLTWTGRLLNLTGLAFAAGIQALLLALAALGQTPLLAVVAIAELTLPLVALVLLAGLWLHRFGPAQPRPAGA